MTKHIGSLGRKREPLDIDFDYFGNTVRVHPYASDAVEVEFLEAGKDIDIDELQNLDITKFEAMDDEEQVRVLTDLTRAQREGFKAMMRALRSLVHPDDFDTYWKVGNANGQQVRDRMADIKAITTAVIEATTDFPTGPPSGSPGGPVETPASSAVVSPSAEVSDYEAGLALYRGRPDLQEFFVMQRESDEAAKKELADLERRDQEKLRAAGLA